MIKIRLLVSGRTARIDIERETVPRPGDAVFVDGDIFIAAREHVAIHCEGGVILRVDEFDRHAIGEARLRLLVEEARGFEADCRVWNRGRTSRKRFGGAQGDCG